MKRFRVTIVSEGDSFTFMREIEAKAIGQVVPKVYKMARDIHPFNNKNATNLFIEIHQCVT